MSLESKHPLYEVYSPDWLQQRDLYAGERQVKSKGVTYLPATPSMILDGMQNSSQIGWKNYEAYKTRAVFPEYIQEGVAVLIGMMHYKDARIELPAVMEPLRTRVTLTGETLMDLLRRINAEQLLTGRIGLLADLPTEPVATPATIGKGDKVAPLLPYIETYVPEAILNWDESASAIGFRSLNLVTLDEGGLVRDTEFEWKAVKRVRVLQLGTINENEPEGSAVYRNGLFEEEGSGGLQYDSSKMIVPTYQGKPLQEIPFIFVNSRDLLPQPDVAPLIALGRLVLAIYRGEADLRQALFMQGQDTLVVIGGVRNPDGTAGADDAIRTGAGSRIDVDQGGDAKYIGVQSQGLSELRSAVESDRKRAEHLAGKLAQPKFESESGEALTIRLSAQTANLNQIAWSGARGLESILKIIAKWIGANPEEVKVTPNLEFGEPDLDASSIHELLKARELGAPISKQSLHALLTQKRFTTMTFEEEMEIVEEEDRKAQEEMLKEQAALEKLKPKPKAPAA